MSRMHGLHRVTLTMGQLTTLAKRVRQSQHAGPDNRVCQIDNTRCNRCLPDAVVAAGPASARTHNYRMQQRRIVLACAQLLYASSNGKIVSF